MTALTLSLDGASAAPTPDHATRPAAGGPVGAVRRWCGVLALPAQAALGLGVWEVGAAWPWWLRLAATGVALLVPAGCAVRRTVASQGHLQDLGAAFAALGAGELGVRLPAA